MNKFTFGKTKYTLDLGAALEATGSRCPRLFVLSIVCVLIFKLASFYKFVYGCCAWRIEPNNGDIFLPTPDMLNITWDLSSLSSPTGFNTQGTFSWNLNQAITQWIKQSSY